MNLENVMTGGGHAALNMLTFKLLFFTAFKKSQQSNKSQKAKVKAKKDVETGNSNSSPCKDCRVGGRVG